MNFPQQVRVEIDELVLTGFSQSDGKAIAESVHETLSRLFTADIERWNQSDPSRADTLNAGKVQVHRSGRAKSTGERIARAIYGSLPR